MPDPLIVQSFKERPGIGAGWAGATGWVLLVLLWMYQVRFQTLSFPAEGQLVIIALAALMAPAWLVGKSHRRMSVVPQYRWEKLTALTGAAFVVYLFGRWLLDGRPAVGGGFLGSVFISAGSAFAAYYFLGAWFRVSTVKWKFAPIQVFFVLMSLLAMGCGIHAVWQHQVGYGLEYQALLKQIGKHPGDATQSALLHHFQIRRVASIWGDPNVFAAFMAMSIPCSLELGLTVRRFRLTVMICALGCVLLACVGILLSGSRGGFLDAMVVFAVYSVLIWRGKAAGRILWASIALGLLFVLAGMDGRGESGSPEPGTGGEVEPAKKPASWVWRSDTIRERIYYLEVGWEMFREHPVFGYGVGSVDHYFGKFKPQQARETRYLHNWVAQLGAETGMVGVLLASAMLVFFALAVKTSWKQEGGGSLRGLAMVGGLFWFDGLIQVTFNQREMAELWGIVMGASLAVVMSTQSLSRPEPSSDSQKSSLLKFAAPTFGLFVMATLVAVVVPDLRAASYNLAADEAMDAGKVSEAAMDLSKAQTANPRDGDIMLRRARIAAMEGNYTDACLLSTGALSIQPESASTQAFAAELSIQDGNWIQARKYAHAAIKRYPFKPEYQVLLARIENADGNTTAAETLAKKAVEYSVGLYNQHEFEDFLEQLESGGKTAGSTLP